MVGGRDQLRPGPGPEATLSPRPRLSGLLLAHYRPCLQRLALQDRRAPGPVDLKPRGKARVDGCAPLDDAEGAVLEPGDGRREVFHLYFVRHGAGLGPEAVDGAHDPAEEVYSVDGLVDEGAASLGGPPASPWALLVVVLVPEPLDHGLSQNQAAEPAPVGGLLDPLRGGVEPGLEDDAQLHAVLPGHPHHLVGLPEADGHGLVHEGVLLRPRRVQGHGVVEVVRRVDGDRVDVGLLQHPAVVGVPGRQPPLLRELPDPLLVDVGHRHQPHESLVGHVRRGLGDEGGSHPRADYSEPYGPSHDRSHAHSVCTTA